MNGDQLREALRDEMLNVTAPPHLNADGMLRSARRTRTMRRAVRAAAMRLPIMLAMGALRSRGLDQ